MQHEAIFKVQPQEGTFWFIGEESAKPLEQRPMSFLAGVFYAYKPRSVAKETAIAASDDAGSSQDPYFPPDFSQLCWSDVQNAHSIARGRNHLYYAGGEIYWSRALASFVLELHENINRPEFVDVILKCCNLTHEPVQIIQSGAGLSARIGLPEADRWACIPFGTSTPKLAIKMAPAPLAVDEDRAFGALLGLAVGDALGAALEFTRRDSRPKVVDLVGGGPFGLKPGEWTDDTSMALCLADSLIELKEFSGKDVIDRFVCWWQHGENSVNGRCFDIGIKTREALDRYVRTGQVWGSRLVENDRAGNGSLMRLAPAAIFAAPDAVESAKLAVQQSGLTHSSRVVSDACDMFATMLVEAMTGSSKEKVLEFRQFSGHQHPAIVEIARGVWMDKERDDISSSGYVVSTLEAAIWCVWKSSSFEEALILAANLGEDSDTVAAVTGQLAGALWGRSAIPPRWLEKLAWRGIIEDRVERLLKIAGRRDRNKKR